MKNLQINGLYEHYSGKRYKVLGEARHTETLEELVLYQALYFDEEFQAEGLLWVRPKAMFLGNVERDGKVVERFRLIESK